MVFGRVFLFPAWLAEQCRKYYNNLRNKSHPQCNTNINKWKFCLAPRCFLHWEHANYAYGAQTKLKSFTWDDDNDCNIINI